MRTKTGIRLLAFLFIFFVFFTKPVAAENWHKYSNLPVLATGPNGSWDSSEIRDPFVTKISGQYKMWYTGGNGDYTTNTLKIGYATSSDGIHWVKHPNPVIDLQGANTDLTSPTIVLTDNIYRLWLEADNNENNTHELDYAASFDGVNWTSPIPINLPKETWSSNAIVHPDVFLKNNIFNMFYSGTDGNAFSIGSATSNDGINWINSLNNPILQSTQAENFLVSAPSIMMKGNIYNLFYSSNFPQGVINLATSQNLVTWTKQINNPILSSTNSTFDENTVGSPSVIKDGNEYKMYYSGLDDNGHWQIGLATASADVQLQIPLLKQTQSPWQSQEYDSAHVWSPQNKTISTWGCALTSAAMILQYYGENKLPDGTLLNPGSLNTWLKAHHGYDDGVNNGYLVPQAISQLSHAAKNINNITAFDALETQLVQTNDIQQVTNDLQNNQPVMLGVNNDSHYVVATGTSGNTLTINDPYYTKLTLADGYNNTFHDMTRYTPSFTDLSYIVITAPQGLTLSVTDAHHNPVGFTQTQPPLTSDDTNTPSGNGSQIIFFQKPATGTYTLTVSGSTTQTYRLNVYEYDTNGNLSFHDTQGDITPNQTNTIPLIFNKTDATKSSANKIATFDTLINDINTLTTLQQVKRNANNALLQTAQQAKNNAGKGNLLVEKIQLQTMMKLLQAEQGNVITDTAFQILQYDVLYLASH